jgi:hypothetical protein
MPEEKPQPALPISPVPSIEPAQIISSDVFADSDVITPHDDTRLLETLMNLKTYCDGLKIPSSLEESLPYRHLRIDFPNGRIKRAVYVDQIKLAEELSNFPLDEIVFLGNLSAVCSYKGGWIEAEIRQLAGPLGTHLTRSRLFRTAAQSSGSKEICIQSSGNIKLFLAEMPRFLLLLERGHLYLRVEGIDISQHDAALAALEELANSLFIQLDLRYEIPLSLSRKRRSLRRGTRSAGNSGAEDISFPKHCYDPNPSSLYWYARSATSMPLLQFLAFYQCLEFFFPYYSRQETIQRIRHLLKDPTFDGSRDNDISVLLNTVTIGQQGIQSGERNQLRSVLVHCVEAQTIREFLISDETRKKYYESEFKDVSKVRISLREDGDVINQTAERIYDIRCKVVHMKNLESSAGSDIILPFSREADLLADDIELIKFLARRVLIASSSMLHLKDRVIEPDKKDV